MTQTIALPPADWNRTEREYPAAPLHEAFQQQVARTPNAIAIRFREATLTYHELNLRSDALAAKLAELGAGPGTLTAVCMERSLEMVVALYGILKAGSAYVPIDPEYPAERISFMLEDTAAPILLTQRALSEHFTGARAQVVAVDQVDQADDGPAPAPPVSKATLNDLAYVIYTSGSTGQPKGAMNTHRAISNRIQWMQDAYGLTPADRVLQKTPFSFDVSVWEFFWPLLFGAELVIAEPGGHGDSSYLAQVIMDQGITTIHFVPAMLQLFLEDPRAGDCASLQRVICSGEALPKAVQDRFFGRLDAELHNVYGPSGYLNRPELTAERFIDDPFSGVPDARLYKTGDLVRYLPDGNIEFLGRSDFQVKIRGFRVELGEIEAALEAIAGVRQAIVVARERSGGDLELVAYVSSSNGDGPTTDPAAQMEALCRRLGLAFDPAITQPYEQLDAKMVDGVYPESAPMGDPGFLAHGRIDPSAADAAGRSAPTVPLGAPTREVAARLGYDLSTDGSADRRTRRDALARQHGLRRSARGSGQ